MTRFRCLCAISAARFTTAVLHAFGRGGTSLPGMVALKFCPDLLRDLSADTDVVLVTGTNGKTTTTHMIAQVLSAAKIPFFTNDAGANMITGITAAFINKKHKARSHSTKINKRQVALLECDEASLRKVTRYIQSRVIVVTNLFRDQLDRYGEITTTLQLIREGIAQNKDAVLCLNADCSYTASLGHNVSNKVLYFGMEQQAAEFGAQSQNMQRNYGMCGNAGGQNAYSDNTSDEHSACDEDGNQAVVTSNEVFQAAEALSCLYCGNAYKYHYRSFGHLGGFYCPQCGWQRPQTQIKIERIKTLASDYSEAVVDIAAENVMGVAKFTDDVASACETNSAQDAIIDVANSDELHNHKLHIDKIGADETSSSAITRIDENNGMGNSGASANEENISEVHGHLLKLSLPAKFNLYNAAAALAVAHEFAIDEKTSFAALEHLSSSFGRMECFDYRDVSLLMLLIKNPTGADQVLDYVENCLQGSTQDSVQNHANESSTKKDGTEKSGVNVCCASRTFELTPEPANLVLCLNDKDADGTDVSWIWDVAYERIASWNCNKIIVWGTRAYDMRVRLLYAGVDRTCIEVVKDNNALLDAVAALGKNNAAGIDEVRKHASEEVSVEQHAACVSELVGENSKDAYNALTEKTNMKAVLDMSAETNQLASKEKTSVYMLANYTSMMELRDVFARTCGKKAFWDSQSS